MKTKIIKSDKLFGLNAYISHTEKQPLRVLKIHKSD
jgi:hypothetical protein